MKYTYIIITLFVRFIITASGNLYAQTTDIISAKNIDSSLQFDHSRASKILFNPFPTMPLSIVQPLDSLSTVKNIVKLNLGHKQLVITLSNDFKTINISESINEERLCPFQSSLDWYIKQLYKKTWKNKYLEIMSKIQKMLTKERANVRACWG